MVDEGLDQDPLTPAAGTHDASPLRDLGGETGPVPGNTFHLERSTDGLDTVEPPQPRPMPRVGPAHAVVLDLDPDPAIASRHGHGGA